MSAEQLIPRPTDVNPTPSRVTQPGKLIRITAVAHAMLDEARSAPCDAAGCERLRAVYIRTIEELRGLLSDDLSDELSHLEVPFEDPAPTPSEIRVAQAELVGWLEGLLTGIASSIATQREQAQTGAPTQTDRLPGHYL